MIMQITGKIVHQEGNFLIAKAGGIGYKVHVLYEVIKNTKRGSNVLLWTRLVVREHDMELYGFKDRKELDFFELLINVSGIGPKSALAILNLASVEKLEQAIAEEDASYLTKVSGVGRKSAAKIILELKDRVSETSHAGDKKSLRDEEDTLDALISLGYSTTQARDALRQLKDKDLETGEKIKAALKLLS